MKIIYGPLLLLMSLALCLFAAEAGFRFASGMGLLGSAAIELESLAHQYAADPELIYELKPLVHVQTKNMTVQTNSWGMRDEEVSLVKPPGVFRIAVLGDSVSFGFELPSHEATFAEILESRLNIQGKQKYEVLNFSVVGYNSEQEKIVLQKKVAAFAPDVVVAGVCLNDDSAADGLGELTSQSAPWALGSRINSRLLSYLLNRLERVFFGARKDLKRIESFLRALSNDAKAGKYKAVVLLFPYYFDDLNSYRRQAKHEAIHSLADRYGLPLIDYRDLWRDMLPAERRSLYSPADTVHFSALGMQRIAQSLEEYFADRRG